METTRGPATMPTNPKNWMPPNTAKKGQSVCNFEASPTTMVRTT